MDTALRRLAGQARRAIVRLLLGQQRSAGRSLSRVGASSVEYSALLNPIEVPCQVESYLLCRDRYVREGDAVLDVGFGLGFGMNILACKADTVVGVEVDKRAVERATRIFHGHPRVRRVEHYDGRSLPFPDRFVDVVTCVDVLEHVPNYTLLLRQMCRVARRCVFVATPNRRREHTGADGRPKNYWHLREWTQNELDAILRELGVTVEWNYLNGPFEGPFVCSREIASDTLVLAPVLFTAGFRRNDAAAPGSN